ncbi:MAG: LysR family transcriptional regulator [Lachnospiraceae bacterium]
MDTKYLEYILAIAQNKNMTKAAKELYVSQSSLSQYLAKLEQELDTPLFFRAKNELTLTPAGQLYVNAARKIIQIQKQLYHDISSLENKGQITVGVTSQFGLRILSEIIPEFKKIYPDFSIEITETSLPALTKLLLDETIDLGIMAANEQAPFENQSWILQEEEIFFAIPASHPYQLRQDTDDMLPIQELTEAFLEDNFLLSKKGSTLRTIADRIFTEYQFQPRAMCETNSIITTRAMVANGVGVTFIAESCASDRDLVRYYPLRPRLFRHNLLVHRKSLTMHEPEKYFCNLVKACFPDK